MLKSALTITISGIATLGAGAASAVTIDNDITAGTVGAFSVDVRDGGEADAAEITANGQVSGTISDQVIFDYFTYIDTGSGGVRLSDTNVTSSAASSGDDAVSSSGNFTGSGGNQIDWAVTSSIPDGENTMTSTFTFEAAQGTLGDLQLLQYLDEDVFGVSDDVFFTRGSAAGGDLELFTVDDDEVVGISHGGAYFAAAGLENATFEGWAADEYNDMKPRIEDGNQTLSLSGVIEAGLADDGTTLIPEIGTVRGPTDIVSVLGWSVSPDATSATIVTTLGGVPDIRDIPDDPDDDMNVIPLPAGLPLLLAGFGSLAVLRRRRG